jgi:hypothetical protein
LPFVSPPARAIWLQAKSQDAADNPGKILAKNPQKIFQIFDRHISVQRNFK